jgi:hypothetical protein
VEEVELGTHEENQEYRIQRLAGILARGGRHAIDRNRDMHAHACMHIVYTIGTRLVDYSRFQSKIVWALLGHFNNQCMTGAGDCRAPVS